MAGGLPRAQEDRHDADGRPQGHHGRVSGSGLAARVGMANDIDNGNAVDRSHLPVVFVSAAQSEAPDGSAGSSATNGG